MTQSSAAITAYLGGLGDGDSILSMLDDLADLYEQGAADGTPGRGVVGGGPGGGAGGVRPVGVAEAFLRNYPAGQWIARERERLTHSIERAAGEATATPGRSR